MTKQHRDPYETSRTVPFTNKELEIVFDVTLMTLHIWQKGTPTKKPLPVKRRGRYVSYPVRSTMEWARKNGVPVAVHPDDLPATGVGAAGPASLTPKKPGPKPRAQAVAQAVQRERPMATKGRA